MAIPAVLKRLALCVASAFLVLSALLSAPDQAFASPEEAAGLFKGNCAACHALGTNRVIAAKNLHKDALEKYDMYSKDAIVYQVTNGKNAMPAFGGRLKPEQIEAIADYVLEQAELDWPF